MLAQRSGRHRLGRTGLRHCREIPEVVARLTGQDTRPSPAHAAAEDSWSPRPVLATILVTTATALLVAGSWLATQAPAVAGIIGR